MQVIRNLLFSLAGLCFVAAGGSAFAQETPKTPPAGVKLVEAKDVIELQKQGAILVDTRMASEFGEGTLKGAISVPYDPEKSAKDANFDGSLDKFNMAKLADKNAKIVVFCNSHTCWKSYKSAATLSKNGYKNIYWYRAGFPDWKEKKLPID